MQLEMSNAVRDTPFNILFFLDFAFHVVIGFDY